MSNLEISISEIYSKFISEMSINANTGIVEPGITFDTKGDIIRFGGYPYVGSKYATAQRKILFVGLDIGADENGRNNSYHTLEERRNSIAHFSSVPTGFSNNPYNPHISGTYALTLAILRDLYGWQDAWVRLSSDVNISVKKAINNNHNELPVEIIEYIGLTNLFKFVSVNRSDRTGSRNRRWINKNIEFKLLEDEIDIYAPDIIVLQGSGRYLPSSTIESWRKNIFVINGHHPSAWRYGENKISYIKKLLAFYEDSCL